MSHLKIITLVSLVFFLFACNSEKKDGSIVEENNECICTMDYTPVCGKDGKTYSNACQAGCAKVEHTPGECSK